MVSTIEQRVGILFAGAAGSRTRQGRIIASDSAKTCGKVASHYAESSRKAEVRKKRVPTLHSRCMMHMMFISIVVMMGLYNIITPMFCATILCHKWGTMKVIRKHVAQQVEQKLEIVFDEPPNMLEHRAYNEALLHVLECGDIYCDQSYGTDIVDPDPDALTKRKAARKDRVLVPVLVLVLVLVVIDYY